MISVCLLNYNHAHLLESTVESVLAQDDRDFELIISDDSSTDASWTVIQRIAARDSRVHAIRTSRNLGMPGNANFAASAARGDYIALLHHDDIYRPDLLRKWKASLERYPTASFVFNGYAVHESDFVYRIPFPEGRIDGPPFLREYLLTRWDCPVRGTAMVRRQCWREVGGLREEFGLLADVDLWMRLAARYDLAYISEPLIEVRHDPPVDYPEVYGGRGWSWERLRLLFAIHADNTLAACDRGLMPKFSARVKFSLRLNLEIVKWLGYAIVKRRPSMLVTSGDIANPYEYPPVAWLRSGLAHVFRR